MHLNHDRELKLLGDALKITLDAMIYDIAAIKDPKHKIDMVQEYDKAVNWMLHMTKCFDDMNCWLTAFGTPEGA